MTPNADPKESALTPQDLHCHIRPVFQDILAQAASGTRGAAVLDFGSGRGELVGCLRQRGWRAFGIDVCPRYIEHGQLVNRMFTDDFPILSASKGGRTCFPDAFFDLIISDQVLEHVQDIDKSAKEIGRILKTGGITLHIFPSRHSLVEMHLKMPIVHWLPKNLTRKAAIRLFLHLGLGDTPLVDVKSRTNTLYKYSIEQTFYRGRREIERAFGAHGIRLDFDSALRAKLGSYHGPGARILRTVSHVVPPYLFLCTLMSAHAIGIKEEK